MEHPHATSNHALFGRMDEDLHMYAVRVVFLLKNECIYPIIKQAVIVSLNISFPVMTSSTAYSWLIVTFVVFLYLLSYE